MIQTFFSSIWGLLDQFVPPQKVQIKVKAVCEYCFWSRFDVYDQGDQQMLEDRKHHLQEEHDRFSGCTFGKTVRFYEKSPR